MDSKITPFSSINELELDVGKNIECEVTAAATARPPVISKSNANMFLKMPRMKYKYHQPIHSVAVLDIPDIDDTFVIASDEKSVAIWSLRFGDLLLDIPGEHDSAISVVTAYVDDVIKPLIITGSWDETIHVWSLNVKCNDVTECTGNHSSNDVISVGKRITLQGHTNRILTLKATENKEGLSCKDGPVLVSGGADCTLRVWSLRTLTFLYELSHCSIVTWVLCLDIYYSQEKDCSVVVCGGKDSTLRFWLLKNPSVDNRNDEINSVLPFRTISNCPSRVVALSITDATVDEPLIAVVCKNYLIIRVFSTLTGKLVRRLIGHKNPIMDIETCYSMRYQSHLLVSVSSVGNIRGWNPVTGELLRSFRGHTGMVYSACLCKPINAPDDVIIVSGMSLCSLQQ
jgi:WD40 repeat protein